MKRHDTGADRQYSVFRKSASSLRFYQASSEARRAYIRPRADYHGSTVSASVSSRRRCQWPAVVSDLPYTLAVVSVIVNGRSVGARGANRNPKFRNPKSSEHRFGIWTTSKFGFCILEIWISVLDWTTSNFLGQFRTNTFTY